MAGKQHSVTLSKELTEQVEFVARKLHMTPPQFIRFAVEQQMQRYNLFELAGGILPTNAVTDKSVQDEDSGGNRNRPDVTKLGGAEI